MRHSKKSTDFPPHNLASIFRGLYARVSERLDVHPSFVSRVARGERQSEVIEAALMRETRRIMKKLNMSHNGSRHNGNGNGHRSTL